MLVKVGFWPTPSLPTLAFLSLIEAKLRIVGDANIEFEMFGLRDACAFLLLSSPWLVLISLKIMRVWCDINCASLSTCSYSLGSRSVFVVGSTDR